MTLQTQHRFIHSLALVVVTVSSFCTPVFGGFDDRGAEQIQQASASRLSSECIRVARTVLQIQPLSVNEIEVGAALVKMAAEIDPNNPDIWRAWVEMATISDDPEMRQLGVKELLRLFPNETPLQLARLRDAVDTLNNASERESLYEQLLSPENQAKLNPSVAARLAFDSAMLQRQLGNTQQFARWLAESVALDPYFTDATAVAVGFFGDESSDPYRRVELLSSLMLANMRDVTTQVSLAELLMSFGAYKGASRIYDIALADNANNTSEINNNLLSDMVMAHWAAGNKEAALDIIAKRQRIADEKFRKIIQKQQPRATPLELARVHSPLSPKLATIKAAVYSDAEQQEAEWALRQALDSFASVLVALEDQPDSSRITSVFIEHCLQAAWVSVWLGNLVESAENFLLKAETYAPVSEPEKNHIRGWIALRSGDTETAEKLFTSLGEERDSTIVGLALVRLSQGRDREAAHLFLQVARDSAGTLVGIWSRNQLEKLLGQEIVARGGVGAIETLIENIPSTVDEYPTNPTVTYSIRANAVSTSVGPYQPILIEIELSNNGLLPMQIAQQGPIQPVVLLQANTQIVNTSINNTIPIIIPINRKLILYPRERFTITVDLRNYWVGSVFNEWPTGGGFLQFYAISNFSIRTAENIGGSIVLVYEPTTLGSKSNEAEVYIEGVKPTDQWLKNALAKVNEMNSPDDLISFALLTWVVGDDTHIQVVEPLITPPPGEEVKQIPEGERHPLQDEAITTLLMKFPSLDITSKAWILSVMSRDPSFESFVGMADVDESDITTIAWMLRFVSPTVDDVVLDNVHLLSALKDSNPRVRLIANWIYGWVEKRVNQRREKALGITGDE